MNTNGVWFQVLLVFHWRHDRLQPVRAESSPCARTWGMLGMASEEGTGVPKASTLEGPSETMENPCQNAESCKTSSVGSGGRSHVALVQRRSACGFSTMGAEGSILRRISSRCS